ncbi:MAG: TlpA family protein disulfide reductase [Paracoccus sp. (in: a-proteobacteria)]
MPRFSFYVALALLASPAAALSPETTAELRAGAVGPMGKLVVHDAPRAPVEAVFRDEEGRERSFSDWPGEVVFVNIWATWCAPCLKEMPAIDRMAAAFAGAPLRVVAISTDRGDPEKPRRWLAENGVSNLDFYHDGAWAVPQAFAVLGQPTTLILDRRGREVARLMGEAEWDAPEARAVIRAVIEDEAE